MGMGGESENDRKDKKKYQNVGLIMGESWQTPMCYRLREDTQTKYAFFWGEFNSFFLQDNLRTTYIKSIMTAINVEINIRMIILRQQIYFLMHFYIPLTL